MDLELGYALGSPRRSGGGQAPRVPGTLYDLIQQQGQQQAEASQQQGQIWGNTLQNIGQQIGGAIQEYGEQKAVKKRDAAWLQTIQGPDFWANPQQAYAQTIKVWGPEKGPEQFKAAVAVHQLGQEKRDPVADGKALQAFGKGLLMMDPSAQAAAWPQARALAHNAYPQLGLPEHYDETWAKEVLTPLVNSGGEAPKTREVKTRNADGSERVQIVEDKPGFDATSAAAPEKPQVVHTVDARGNPITRMATAAELASGVPDYKAPTAPRAPEPLVSIKGPDGMDVYVPRSQAVGQHPGGSGGAPKPPTGGERQALAYYNRAKGALDDIAPLENKVQAYGVIDQGRLAMKGTAGNVVQSEEMQEYRQAQRAFTEARLRKESGAAINDAEYDKDARTYFAQPGDSRALAQQKKAAREKVLNGLGFAAGNAYQEYYGEPLNTPAREHAASAPPKVTNAQDYAAIPSGALYMTPDGKTKRKR